MTAVSYIRIGIPRFLHAALHGPRAPPRATRLLTAYTQSVASLALCHRLPMRRSAQWLRRSHVPQAACRMLCAMLHSCPAPGRRVSSSAVTRKLCPSAPGADLSIATFELIQSCHQGASAEGVSLLSPQRPHRYGGDVEAQGYVGGGRMGSLNVRDGCCTVELERQREHKCKQHETDGVDESLAPL